MPSLPSQLLQHLNTLGHFDEEAFVQAHSDENKITSIRVNPFKKTDLTGIGLDLKRANRVKWNTEGYYLDTRPSFTLDPLFQAGCYYPQEAGSMFLEFALKECLDFSDSLKVLDVCAAPGGKSTLLNSLLNEKSLLVANEIIKSRADVLVQNLSKWGTCNTVVTNNDPQRFSELRSFFDAVVIDAPCSGSGLFRKQPEAIHEWSEDHVNACSIRQQAIVTDILPSLKENGILVYSTCSYSVAENEEVVEKLVKDWDMEYIPLPVEKEWGVVETPHGYRFYPHLTKSEGFFCAVLRKKNNSGLLPTQKRKQRAGITKTDLTLIEPFLTITKENIVKKNERFHLLSPEASSFLSVFEKQFYFKKAGVVIGEIKGKDLVPNQELAWFYGLSKEINYLEADRETALKFLRKETFQTSENIKGLTLIRYREQGLGWAKILPNRINNYLPNELRILK